MLDHPDTRPPLFLVLSASDDDGRRWFLSAERAGVVDLDTDIIYRTKVNHAQAALLPGGARIVVTDRWPYDQGTVAALAARRAALIDPTGLLGPTPPAGVERPAFDPEHKVGRPRKKGAGPVGERQVSGAYQ